MLDDILNFLDDDSDESRSNSVKTIFVVDDNDVNLTKAKRALEGHYRVLTVPSADKMFNLIKKITPDLILLDIEMPEMDGFAALQKMKESEDLEKIPVVFLTASNDDDVEAKGFKMGAVDFITKPFSPSVLLNRLETHLNINEIIRKRTAKIEQLQNGIVAVMADMVENRDKVTGGPIDRTSTYLKIMLDAMVEQGVYIDEIKGWNFATVLSSARLHDLGKIKITDVILNKPGKLTEEEFEIIRSHPFEGEAIISEIIIKTGEGSFLSHAKLFAGYHHERWNGEGYPYGLKGSEIPLQGRIMAIVDVYDALVSKRPYKEAFTCEKAEDIILKDSGIFFDPCLVDVFMSKKDEFAKAVQILNLPNSEGA